MHLTLENIRQSLASASRPLRLDIELVPEAHVAPGMLVVHRGRATIGHDFFNDGPPSNVYSQPVREMDLPTFAISRDPVTVGDYIPFIQSLLAEGRIEEARQYLPRMSRPPQKLSKSLIAETRRVFGQNGWKAAIENLATSLSGTVYLWRIKSEGRGKNLRYTLEDPLVRPQAPETQGSAEKPAPKVVTEDRDPVYLDQPITSITYHAAEAFTRWRSQRDGRPYRISTIEEYEKVARNSFPWTYPWGYDFDPTFVISRLLFDNVSSAFVQPLAKHLWGDSYYRDLSIYGVRDVIGNARKFTSSQIEENTVMLGGGGAGVPYGPFYLPSTRNYGMYRSSIVPGIGTFYLVQEELAPPSPSFRGRQF